MLVIYGDDFRMGGPRKSVKVALTKLRKLLDLSDPEATRRFLGCNHVLHMLDDRFVMEYNVQDYMMACVAGYLEVAGDGTVLAAATTPYLDLAKIPDDYFAIDGQLSEYCASVLMKFLYGAKFGRSDFLKITGWLARFITNWSVARDMMLFRIVCYVRSTLDLVMFSQVAFTDTPDTWFLELHTDADLGGCVFTKKSTSGSIIGISSTKDVHEYTNKLQIESKKPITWAPISAYSVLQTAVSEDTPQAGILSAAKGLRTDGLPLMELWSKY